MQALTAISPVDGRYRDKVEPLANYFSESALVRYRVMVEIEYFIALCEIPLPQLKDFNKELFPSLKEIYLNFTVDDARRVKDIEQKRGLTRAVALYNPSDADCAFSVPFADLELAGQVKVRDLAERADLGSFSDRLEMTLPARSARFFRLEAENRLEPTVYEAEWAYLPLFNDLGKNSKGIRYAYDAEASGRMKVGFLGGQPENYAEWTEVYSEKGGQYGLTVYYSYGKGRKLELAINGKPVEVGPLADDDAHHSITVPVTLKPGYNVVRMGNSYNWAPDIDRFTLAMAME